MATILRAGAVAFRVICPRALPLSVLKSLPPAEARPNAQSPPPFDLHVPGRQHLPGEQNSNIALVQKEIPGEHWPWRTQGIRRELVGLCDLGSQSVAEAEAVCTLPSISSPIHSNGDYWIICVEGFNKLLYMLPPCLVLHLSVDSLLMS